MTASDCASFSRSTTMSITSSVTASRYTASIARKVLGGMPTGAVAAALVARVAYGCAWISSRVGRAIARRERSNGSACSAAPAWQSEMKRPRSPTTRAEQPGQPAKTAAERHARGADSRTLPEHGHETVASRGHGHLPAEHARLRPHQTALGIDRDPTQRCQVDTEPVRSAPREMAVPAGPHRDLEAVAACELDGTPGVVLVGAAHDHRRPRLGAGVPIEDTAVGVV